MLAIWDLDLRILLIFQYMVTLTSRLPCPLASCTILGFLKLILTPIIGIVTVFLYNQSLCHNEAKSIFPPLPSLPAQAGRRALTNNNRAKLIEIKYDKHVFKWSFRLERVPGRHNWGYGPRTFIRYAIPVWGGCTLHGHRDLLSWHIFYIVTIATSDTRVFSEMWEMDIKAASK